VTLPVAMVTTALLRTLAWLSPLRLPLRLAACFGDCLIGFAVCERVEGSQGGDGGDSSCLTQINGE